MPDGDPADDPPASSPGESADEPAAADTPRTADAAATDAVLTLPSSLRPALKAPMGPVVETVEALLDGAGAPVVAVGDVVTAELLRADRPPALAVVDGRTKRQPVAAAAGSAVAAALETLPAGRVAANPPGTYTAGLLETLAAAVEAVTGAPPPADVGDVEVVDVDGEEDLAVLPAIALAPDGATVVYGQPGEGMVRVDVDETARREALDLLERFEGDHGRLHEILGTG
ncbi:MAG: GTP-dependent dephospho-CoA kinase family protein [Halobacteriaceae archaeon]